MKRILNFLELILELFISLFYINTDYINHIQKTIKKNKAYKNKIPIKIISYNTFKYFYNKNIWAKCVISDNNDRGIFAVDGYAFDNTYKLNGVFCILTPYGYFKSKKYNDMFIKKYEHQKINV